jgi:signal transduction histidine kinase
MDDLQLPFTERLSARQWVVIDVFVAIALAAASAGQVAGVGHIVPSTLTGTGWDVVRYLAVVAACAPLPLRRRSPVGVLGVIAVSVALLDALGGQYLALLAVTPAVYSVAAASARRASLAAVAAAVAVMEISALSAARGSDGTVALYVLAAAVAGWLAGENSRVRRVYVKNVAERAAEREGEREERARRAGLEERMRIARELHDVVAHAMSIITVRSGVARAVIDVRPGEAREALGIIEDTSRQALSELRLLVGVLRATEPEASLAERAPAPGLADLPELVTQVTQAGVAVSVSVEGEPRRLPSGVDLSAYRIVQEGLTNVVRHAAPASAELTLGYRPAEVVIEITDDGRTQDRELPLALPKEGAGHGLAGMRERVAVYGGKLIAEPTRSGFRLLARIPTSEAGT